MLATVFSAALQGIEAELVHVEVNAGETGEPDTVLVGLPDAAVKESKDRVSSALSNSGFKPPETRTTVNLAPGHLRKEGPCYDLPIALGMLAATDRLAPDRLDDFLIAGELSLSGATRSVRGALAMARLAQRLGKKGLLLPPESAAQAALLSAVEVYAVSSLDQAFRFLAGEVELARATPLPTASVSTEDTGDFADVKGQHAVRRAVEVAVAGGHNLLMIGPPGSGKSMIAKRVPSIMPDPSLDEALEVLSVQSVAAAGSHPADHAFGCRPVRSPHHTISDVGLLGGGTVPGPGEVSLAHHGVLFLDELPEFKRSALEVLRQPLEDGVVTISRSAGKVTLPCAFMLVAAMNPCPCGYLGDADHACRCTPTQVQRYRARVSGPLLDRIDLHVEAPAVSVSELRNAAPGESSATIRARVAAARTRQQTRFAGTKITCNARMTHAQVRRVCAIDRELGDLLERAMNQLSLSARAYDRILKVARTIADLADAERIAAPHLLEAIQYRSLDRTLAL
ncbi:YifB family Mg chelatase-like AAA ATPase [Synoicihabitans lomoniglobus]|uniref:YifB family Mg chelatase-like AAA ATPase n=1 Tax=Synoicihabitans lomoniglobus TaxID=2909285 RepID=A0AAF0CSH8_9BACT|nr:YifB family Mg chelatase-like AAA ATPase [Opitutaceae bacterium LMO-M01]WED67206.1 YifB family Mg chelatase-like AAA ATPase [Opitutaceae bacterium LMO-M01]